MKMIRFKMLTNSFLLLFSFGHNVEDEKTYYVVMDYCQGGSLVEKIREKSRKEELEVLLCKCI